MKVIYQPDESYSGGFLRIILKMYNITNLWNTEEKEGEEEEKEGGWKEEEVEEKQTDKNLDNFDI